MQNILVKERDYTIDPITREALATRAQELVSRPAGELRLPVEAVGVAPVFLRPRTLVADSKKWEIMPIQADPEYLAGNLAVPSKVIGHLRVLADAGVDVDIIYIAHERQVGVHHPVGESLWEPLFAMKRGLDQLALGVDRGVEKAAVPIAAGVVAPFYALGVGLAAVVSGLAKVDPVLFGVITSDGRVYEGTPGMWFCLARWEEQ